MNNGFKTWENCEGWDWGWQLSAECLPWVLGGRRHPRRVTAVVWDGARREQRSPGRQPACGRLNKSLMDQITASSCSYYELDEETKMSWELWIRLKDLPVIQTHFLSLQNKEINNHHVCLKSQEDESAVSLNSWAIQNNFQRFGPCVCPHEESLKLYRVV